MEKSHILKKMSVVSGLVGIFALALAWCAEYRGFVFGFESRVWYNNAIIFLLIGIWFKLGAIYHKGDMK